MTMVKAPPPPEVLRLIRVVRTLQREGYSADAIALTTALMAFYLSAWAPEQAKLVREQFSEWFAATRGMTSEQTQKAIRRGLDTTWPWMRVD